MKSTAGSAVRAPGTSSASVMLICLLLAGCTAPVPTAPTLQTPFASAPPGHLQWWQVKVRMGFESGQAINWHVDTLLADQVFAPIVRRYGHALSLWRVHRRAADDEAGHQTSLLFYADPDVAIRIITALRASATLDDLKRAGIVQDIDLPTRENSVGDALSATSDANWPMEIQRSWPYFIMGVSQHWLALIAEVRGKHELPPSRPITTLLDAYQIINDEVDTLWRTHAQHAYLHHLNALFGYQPMLLQERRMARF